NRGEPNTHGRHNHPDSSHYIIIVKRDPTRDKTSETLKGAHHPPCQGHPRPTIAAPLLGDFNLPYQRELVQIFLVFPRFFVCFPASRRGGRTNGPPPLRSGPLAFPHSHPGVFVVS